MVRWLLDLVLAAALTALAGVGFFMLDGIARIALVLPLIIFLPGYGMLSVLFPEESKLGRARRGRRPWGSPDRRSGQGSEDDYLLGNIERFVLSIALSLALVAFTVFGLNFTVGFGEPQRIAILLMGFTGSMLIFALARRIVLPPEERFALEFSAAGIPTDAGFLSVFGVSLLVLAASAGAFVALNPTPDGGSSGLSIVDQGTLNGGVAATYNGEPVTLSIQNAWDTSKEYSIVAKVDGERHGDPVTATAEPNSFKEVRFENMPEGGERITFYLFEGSPPEEVSRDTAIAVAPIGPSEGQNAISAPAVLAPIQPPGAH
ncbi:DUF1616 domain-containing protein [Halocatena halophila]|uniref:DUF1616 domain-containing protein n=1 Tax=Halocatena halophila TaxID=2814576 RepID=UPI002ED07DC4